MHLWKKLTNRRRAQDLRHRQRRATMILEVLETRALLTAVPGLEPLIFIPGFGGTFSADESDAGVQKWLTQRGLPPDQLQLEPIGNVYYDVVDTLENVGYKLGKSLFVVNWDWRLPVAPVDADSLTNPDGMLSAVTVAGITDDAFETGLDYLGFTLKQATTQFAALNGGATLGC